MAGLEAGFVSIPLNLALIRAIACREPLRTAPGIRNPVQTGLMPPKWHRFDLRVGEPVTYVQVSSETKGLRGRVCTVYKLPDHQG